MMMHSPRFNRAQQRQLQTLTRALDAGEIDGPTFTRLVRRLEAGETVVDAAKARLRHVPLFRRS